MSKVADLELEYQDYLRNSWPNEPGATRQMSFEEYCEYANARGAQADHWGVQTPCNNPDCKPCRQLDSEVDYYYTRYANGGN